MNSSTATGWDSGSRGAITKRRIPGRKSATGDSGDAGPPVTASGIVTLTTDFGQGSPYVAALKGALLSAHPAAVIADLSHSVPAYDLQTASFLIWAGVRSFPAGSVHLAVIDPGVGTDRRAIAFELGGSYFVGPDNGIFSMVIEEARPRPVKGILLSRPAGASRTFEGRDVFAPAAGRLAAGEKLTALGSPAGALKTLPALPPMVLWVDAWGNLITSLRPPVTGVRVRGHEITASAVTFGAAPRDQLFHYVGSLGLVEVAVREGRADRLLDVVAGERVSQLG